MYLDLVKGFIFTATLNLLRNYQLSLAIEFHICTCILYSQADLGLPPPLTDIYNGFPQSVQANVSIATEIYHNSPFKFTPIYPLRSFSNVI
jgi:hypothetical protein